ncbi:MAG: 2-oxoacid:acceptor oxidoreductase family protein [Dehalococcoidales bacterium]|nr:2-oxoacid:acceptor oxidoreductase family protein [Dehalococcoidales bacterium]
MTNTAGLVEIRWHGRGGQGAVTSAELLAQAAINEGKYAQAFPAFGAERRGAPVVAFVRINSDNPIRVRAEIDEPDIVVVLASDLLRVVNVSSGLKADGILVINTPKTADEIIKDFHYKWTLATVDATRIARETLGVPIVNTAMVGALLKAAEVTKLESLIEPLKHRFGRLADKNINAMQKAYEGTTVRGKSN